LGYTAAPGEWGGKYGNGVPSDVTWENTIAKWYNNMTINSTFYWDWNPNSGDTEGILKSDWATLNPNKVKLLQGYWGN